MFPPELVIQCLLVSVIITCLVFLSYINSRKYRHYPPGPMALPIIGNLPNLGTDPRKTLQKYGKIYGDVFSVYFGPQLAIILNSYESIKEAFVQHGSVFNDRPDFFFQDIWDNKGVATVSGELWKQQKRFVVQAMNSIGRKKQVFQNSIEREADLLVDYFLTKSKSQEEIPIDVMDTVLPAVCSVICTFLWSVRCDISDPVCIQKLDRMKENFELIGGTQILNLFPSLKYIPGDPFRYKKFIQNIECDITLNRDCIYQHNLSRDPHNPRDFVDVFLNEGDQQKNNSNYTDAQLHRVLLDMFGAGTQSSAAVLVWSVLYMLHYPDILDKVQSEIQEAVGTRSHIKLEDRPNLLYTEATVLEIIRMSDVTPLGIPHATSEDITFKGFHIPKGTTVMSNLNAVSRDPKLWYDPTKFMPERFLVEKDGILSLNKPEYFIPFSTGKRSCPGNNLAIMELLIFFANMVHNLDFAVPHDRTLPSLEGILSTVYMPPDVRVIAKKREFNIKRDNRL